jgi:superfamily II RNA helicase
MCASIVVNIVDKYKMSTAGLKVCIDDVVDEGKVIYLMAKKYKASKGEMTKADYEDLHKKITTDHKDFAAVYIMTIRVIVYEGRYYKDVMRKYIEYLSKTPWNDKKEFLDRQAQYLFLIQRELNPRANMKTLHQYRENVRKSLHEEDDKFAEYAKEVTKTVDAEIEDTKDDRRDRLYQQLKQLSKLNADQSATPSPQAPLV